MDEHPSFLIGIAAAWFYDRYAERLRQGLEARAWMRWGGADALLIAAVYALGLLFQEVTYLGFFYSETHWHAWHVAEAFLWALLVLLVLVAPVKLGYVLDNRVLKRLGVLSYSLYLIHMPILFFFLFTLRNQYERVYAGWNLASGAAVALCIAIAVTLSSLTYYFIEQPFLRRKARVVS